MSKRRLRPDEQELWNQVARSTKPLRPKRSFPEEHDTAPERKPTKPSRQVREPIQPFSLGERVSNRQKGHELAPSISASLASQPVDMDKKAFTRLKRGKLRPDARIDLHGMTLDQAHPALTRFILNAQAEGKRLVLVITGKGKPSQDDGPIPRRTGVLRHNVPYWLRSGATAAAVMQISESHIRHGGTGAFYVYLRKRR